MQGDPVGVKGFLNGPVVDVHGPVRHDKGLVSQVLICELAPACKGVVPADHDLIGLPEAGMGAVFWILREIGPLSSFRVHAGDKDHIQLPFMEILKERRGGGFPDLDLHAGVELGKIGHQRGQAVVQAEIDAAHPEGALAVAAVLFHGVEHPFITDHHLFGVSDEVTACRGQLHAAGGALKDGDPQLLLQPADAFGQGGLRAVELKGCLQKCAVFYHRQHVADLVQLQQSTPSQNDPFHYSMTPAPLQ